MRGETAWLIAKSEKLQGKLVEQLTPQMQYAIRRVGGYDRLEGRQAEFAQAWNEAPFVDADEDTVSTQTLVRIHELKDGVR